MSGKYRWIKITVVSLLIGVLLGGALTAGKILFAPGAERLLKSGEETYLKGVEAQNAGDAAKAALRFDEANLQASKVLAQIDKEDKELKNREGAEMANLERMRGEAFWLKARALRDHYFAKAIADGQPLPETPDSTTGEKFRSVFAIPDLSARGEAHDCLRQAGRRLTDKAEVQKEALRTETMLPAINWELTVKLANQTLAINAHDTRALSLLARYEFEQPVLVVRTGATMLIQPSKRSRERILHAREHVQSLKETDNYPLWRTLFLEAEIAQWLRDDAVTHSNPRREQDENAKLRDLLTSKNGALARARAGEAMERLSSWDVQGLLGLHLMAMDLAVQDSRKSDSDTEKVVQLLNATLGLCLQLADKDKSHVADCVVAAIAAMSKAQPALLSELPSGWRKDLDVIQELARKARDQNESRPVLYENLASLLSREAYLEGKRGHKERRAELDKQALQWIEDGLRLGTDAKLPPIQLAALNTLAAEMKTNAGAKPEQIAAHLNALKEVKVPRATALVALLEAAAAEREGRLDRARKLLEQVLASTENDLILRAHMVLSNVYLALSQPDKALISLKQVERAYTVFEQLSPQEKAWALEFFRSPEDLALLMMSASADSALNKGRELAQRNPGKPLPPDTLRRYESDIAKLRKKLQKETPQDRRARQIMAVYYAVTQRRDLADKEMADLRTYYPNSVDALRTEITLLSIADPSAKPRKREQLIEDADKRIKGFLKDNSADLDAHYYWVEWLTRSGRAGEAVAYLQSPTHFADTKNERYQRVLAAVLLAKGDRADSQKVLEHLPHDPNIDAMLIQAASAGDRDKMVQQAVSRYESNGMFQTWQGVLAFDKRDYPAAADAFLKAGQYTRYQATAKRGLIQSLLALARIDPIKARTQAGRMIKGNPEEPLLLLASAYASLLFDDIGTPNDRPDPVKSMAASLNAWEQLTLQQTPQARVAAPLTKAAFWILASRQDLALSETARALSMDPKNEAALRQAILLALELRDPDLISDTQKRLNALKKAQPDKPEPLFLQARLDEFNDRPAEAVKIYQDLLKKDPKLSSAYVRLDALLVQQGAKDKALDSVRRWRKAMPDEILAAQTEVRLLAQTKQMPQALRAADGFIDEQIAKERKRLEGIKPAADAKPMDVAKARQTQLDQERLYLELRMILSLMQAKAWGEVENWLTRLLDKKPDLEPALVLRGDAAVAQLSWEKARKEYEKVLAKNKNNVAAANNLAWMLAKHFNKAADALPMVQELRLGRFSHKPMSGDRLRPEFLDTLGEVYAKMNKGSLYGEMRDLFETARLRYPHDPRMYLFLGRAYAGLLETEKAERLYNAAAEVAHGTGQKFLTPEKCKEVLAEIQAAQKKLKQTAMR